MDEEKGLLSSKTNWIGILQMLLPIIMFALKSFGIEIPGNGVESAALVGGGAGVIAARSVARKRIKGLV